MYTDYEFDSCCLDMNAEYVHVMTRQLYRYVALRMYVCDCKMEAKT